MRKILYCIAAVVSVLTSAYGQKVYNHWYFGNLCGIDFTGGAPVFDNQGKLSTSEGCSAISDKNGNLLFYTDGISVWNANHTLMPNGTGLTANGSSTQAALIVPAPGNPSMYYIFTTNSGIEASYNTVDITLNGGLGDVVNKNVLIYTNTTERVCAIKHANKVDYWIVFHSLNNDEFRAYLLTSAGLNMTYVQTNIGTVHTPGGDEIGYLKANYQGTKLGIGVRYQDLYELYDFDNSTGIISNLITLSPFPYAYGIEYSLDGKYMYLSHGLSNGEINQLDISSNNQATIMSSKYLVANVSSGTNGAIQMGPDYKIYQCAWGLTALNCINDPAKGQAACSYTAAQVPMSTSSNGGLPNCVPAAFSTVFIDGLCFGDTTWFSFSDSGSILVASWNFGDPNSSNNTSTLLQPYHIYSAPGNYQVQLITVNQALITDTVIIDVTINGLPTVNLGNDTSLCIGQSLLLNAGIGGATYLWNSGNTNSTITTTVSGSYTVSVTNIEGCNASDSINVNFVPCTGPVAALYSSDTLWCDKTCIDFFDLSQNNPTSWTWYFQGASPATSTDQNPSSICYNNYGSFDVILVACNAASCDSLFLNNFVTEFQLPTAPIVTYVGDTLYSTQAFSYQWYSTSNINLVLGTNQYFVPDSNGTYFVLISDSNGCQVPSSSTTYATSLQQLLFGTQAIQANVVGQQLVINSSVNIDGETSIRVIDIHGKLISTQMFSHLPKGTTQHINIASWSKGLYFVQVVNNQFTFTHKIIIE